MTSALPKVNVEGPLRVEYDQFGRPIVVGTPKKGPKHGVDSYWYQVGYEVAKVDVVKNFAPIVFSYLTATGRSSEFIPSYPVQSDIHLRRITYTRAQIEKQLKEQKGCDYPKDILDLYDGRHAAYINYIEDVKAGVYDLPADFVSGVGTLNWFWDAVSNDIDVAKSLFNVASIIQSLQASAELFSYGNGPFNQVFNAYLGNFDSASVDPSGGIDALNLTNDCNGSTSYNFRFTVSQGDRSGQYCTNDVADSKKLASKEEKSASNKKPKKAISLSKEELISKKAQMKSIAKARKEMMHRSSDRKISMSDFLIVGPELTKDGSSMMLGNSQIEIGFDGCADLYPVTALWRVTSFFTPRASCYTPSFYPVHVQHGDCELYMSLEVTSVLSRDACFENVENVVLIYDESTDKENVIGGKEHSTILIRQVDGSVQSIYTKIFQGNNERHGLETDFRLFDDADPSYVTISRQPLDWLTDIGGMMKWLANTTGLIPFKSVDEFAENLDSSPIVFMRGGFDNKGNIFTISEGFYNQIRPTEQIDRIYPQDATDDQLFSFLISPRPLPVASQYYATFSRVAKNPSCGFFAAWNNIWANEDVTNFVSYFEYDRTGAIFYKVNEIMAEKGKITFQDLRQIWTHITLQRTGRYVTTGDFQNYASDMFPFCMRETCLTALQEVGLEVGLTQHEIDRVQFLLGETFDGRSVANTDQKERVEGIDFDGRWVLSQLWTSLLGRNLWIYGVPDVTFREVTAIDYAFRLFITEPTGDWTPETPDDSRCLPVRIAGNGYFNYSLILRVLKIGPDFGNPVFYQWYANILDALGLDLNDLHDRQKFIVLALKNALEIIVTGSNANTGLADPATGRANLDLIMDNGVPLHPGWGKNQRPTTLPLPPYVTIFLEEPFSVRDGIPTSNRSGGLFYAQIDCKKNLLHMQSCTQLGFSSLLTLKEVNGENEIIVEPHATDQALFFEGNYVTQDIPMQIKKKKCKKHKHHHHCHHKK